MPSDIPRISAVSFVLAADQHAGDDLCLPARQGPYCGEEREVVRHPLVYHGGLLDIGHAGDRVLCQAVSQAGVSLLPAELAYRHR